MFCVCVVEIKTDERAKITSDVSGLFRHVSGSRTEHNDDYFRWSCKIPDQKQNRKTLLSEFLGSFFFSADGQGFCKFAYQLVGGGLPHEGVGVERFVPSLGSGKNKLLIKTCFRDVETFVLIHLTKAIFPPLLSLAVSGKTPILRCIGGFRKVFLVRSIAKHWWYLWHSISDPSSSYDLLKACRVTCLDQIIYLNQRRWGHCRNSQMLKEKRQE